MMGRVVSTDIQDGERDSDGDVGPAGGGVRRLRVRAQGMRKENAGLVVRPPVMPVGVAPVSTTVAA